MLFSNLPSPSPHNCQTICVNYVVGGVVIVCLSNLGLRALDTGQVCRGSYHFSAPRYDHSIDMKYDNRYCSMEETLSALELGWVQSPWQRAF